MSKTQRGSGGVYVYLTLLMFAVGLVVFMATFSYFSASVGKQDDSTFGTLEVAFLDASNNTLTSANFTNTLYDLTPGDTLTISDIKVANTGNIDCYSLIKFTMEITKTDGGITTINEWYNLDGDNINAQNFNTNPTASTLIPTDNAKSVNISYTLDGNQFGNEYKNASIKITLCTYAIQGEIPHIQANKDIYATYLILKDNAGISISNPTINLTLNIDGTDNVYQTTKGRTLQQTITALNLPVNEYTSCGWFDDNEFLDCTVLTNNLTSDTTLYTKTATLDKLCFRNMQKYYSVGGRLHDGTTYIEDDKTGKVAADFVTDTTISGEVVFPCRYKNSAGLDLPVTQIHNLALRYFTDYGKFPFKDTQVSSFVLSTSITYLEYKSFGKCGNLTKLFIHDRVNYINNNCIDSCVNVDEINVSAKSKNYYDINNSFLVQNSSSKHLISCVYAGIENLVIPEEINVIDQHVFSGARLKSVTISNSVTTIQPWCFTSSSIKNINLSSTSNLRFIQTSAFYNCRRIVSFYVTSKVTAIDDDAFLSCTELKTVTVDSSTIYKAITGTALTNAGGLIKYADTINVLKSVVDGANNSNTLLKDTSKYTRTEITITEGDKNYNYYQYKKVV